MTRPEQACASQRLVGRCLRRYREGAGYDLGDAARILDCHPSKVSRVESGHRSIRLVELRLLLAEYGADTETGEALCSLARLRRRDGGWWSEYGQVLPDPYRDLVSVEAAATTICVWAPLQVPELLRTSAYAEAAAAADPCVPEEAEEALTAAALARQQVVLAERKTPVQVLLGEAALLQRTGDPAVMRAQVSHLLAAARSPGVSVRLLPFAAGTSPAGGAGGCTILRIGSLPELGLVHLDGPGGGSLPAAPQAPADYFRVFTRLQALALSPGQTASRLQEAIQPR